ncbi:MAG TPA: DUF502 domain-containing protein [Kofleriaceae bacterium]|nr:DUF502 domain-containing protein [Kofleriaceae bacterium]
MKQLARWFLQGLIYFVPIALTVFVLVTCFQAIDGALGRLIGIDVPGAGILILVVLVTVLGFLLSNYLSRRVLGLVETVLDRLPLVKLLHTSVKDLLGAVVGDDRKFDAPVSVELMPGSGVRALGFVTRDSLSEIGLPEDAVAVYLPQSYNFAGQLLVVPRSRVQHISGESSEIMAFIVSGGVAGRRLA